MNLESDSRQILEMSDSKGQSPQSSILAIWGLLDSTSANALRLRQVTCKANSTRLTRSHNQNALSRSAQGGSEGHKSSFLPNSPNQPFYGFWHMRLKEAFNQAQTGQISFFIENWPRNSIWGSLKIFQFFDHFATTWSQVGQLKTGPNRCFWEGSKIWTQKIYFYSSLRMVFLG